MSSKLREATREWEYEVDTEAARLVESGVPPFDAIAQARDLVVEKRGSRGRIG